MAVLEKLLTIQQSIVAPKDQFNSFGKYKYRSAESILTAVKPILNTTKTVLTISDKVIELGGRNYIQATVTLTDVETSESYSVQALAREEESKKGMDASQVTGASSSYARKYALSGLFAIDDNKDSDATNTGTTQKRSEAPDGYYYCDNCGEIISAVKAKNGSVMSPKQVADYSLTKFGRQLCKDCCEKSHS